MQFVVDVAWEWLCRGKRKELSKPTLLQLCSLPTLIKTVSLESNIFQLISYCCPFIEEIRDIFKLLR